VDDKIDSNRRLARLLEETAAALFRARFVDFVGVEEFDDSELGPIPRGWRAGSLADIASVYRDFGSGQNELPYIGLDAMPRKSTVLADWSTADAPRGQTARFERGDILFGKLRPYFHKVGVAPIRGRCSTEILVLRPIDPMRYGLLLGHVSSTAFIDHCVAVSRGTRMPRAEWKDAGTFRIALPSAPTLREFDDLVRTLYAQIISLTHESRTLAAARDALLPKLISGEIRVPDTTDPAEVIEPLVA
jgi:type I restriction enzyme S subunit